MKLHGKRMLQVIALMLVVLLTSATAAAAAPGGTSSKPSAPTSKMQKYVDAMQPGWNLGNSFDSVGLGGSANPSQENETAWGNPLVTKKQIKNIAAQGFKSIRIPITWEHKISGAPDYTIDPAYMDRIEEVVQWSLDAGLYVMINLHHDSWRWLNTMGDNRTEVLARYNAAWTQISDTFKKYPRKLMFESVNEPQFSSPGASGEQEMLDTLNKSFVQIVRASGSGNKTRPLVLPTMHTSSDQQHLDALYQFIVKAKDPNLIATVHYYGFWPFSVNIAGYTRFEQDTRNDIIQSFDRVHNTFTAKGIPVVIGEFGLLGFDRHTGTIEQGEKLKFFEFMIHYAQSKKLTHMLWDNGQHFNRTTFKWKDPQLFEMIKASWKGRSATADTDLIFIKNGQAPADVTVPLALNRSDNKLIKLTAGGSKLRVGSDYTYSNGQLTFKAQFLSRLTAKASLGDKRSITAKFSKGADWTFHVMKAEKPVLSSAQGTVDSFKIKTDFKGDQLATMEAVYTSGGNAGPQNWTSFKEFSYTFEPDYVNGHIELKPVFFNEVNDGSVLLTFHFWSGEKLTYTITKNGSSVTGTPAS